MQEIFKKIDNEVYQSKVRLDSTKTTGTVHDALNKVHIFNEEFKRLDQVLKDKVNSFAMINDLTESQIQEIKNYLSEAMTGFIQKSGVPGINLNYEVKVK